MNRIGFLLISMLFTSYASHASEYGHHDPKSILKVTKTESGDQHALDLQALDRIVNDLQAHAKSYPPNFETAQEKQRAIKDIQMLTGGLEILIMDGNSSPDLLRRSAFINSIGHNLDIPGAAEKADRDFKSLLAKYPNDPAGNYMYGAFLGGANRGEQALPFLEKAASLGVKDAYFSLGMANLMQKNMDLALKNFEIYKNHRPDDRSVTQIIDAIKSGDIEFKSK